MSAWTNTSTTDHWPLATDYRRVHWPGIRLIPRRSEAARQVEVIITPATVDWHHDVIMVLRTFIICVWVCCAIIHRSTLFISEFWNNKQSMKCILYIKEFDICVWWLAYTLQKQNKTTFKHYMIIIIMYICDYFLLYSIYDKINRYIALYKQIQLRSNVIDACILQWPRTEAASWHVHVITLIWWCYVPSSSAGVSGSTSISSLSPSWSPETEYNFTYTYVV